jgi:beta-glucanase (GH16 family)
MITITEGMTPDLYINALNGNFEEPYETPSFTPVTKEMTTDEIDTIINANFGVSYLVNKGMRNKAYFDAINNKFAEILNDVFNPVLIEEFDGTSVDPAKMMILDDATGKIDYYCDMFGDQYYRASNAPIQNSCLRITATSVPGGDKNYSSGGLSTMNTLRITRGRVEVRAKITPNQGMWPAIWLVEATAPIFAEIDILEQLNHEPFYHISNHAWGRTPQELLIWGTSFIQPIPDFDIFHVWGIDIYDSKLIYWFDGIKVYTFDRITDEGSFTGLPEVGAWLIINLAIGDAGSWTGLPDGTTVWPNYMDIDYVRIYSRN